MPAAESQQEDIVVQSPSPVSVKGEPWIGKLSRFLKVPQRAERGKAVIALKGENLSGTQKETGTNTTILHGLEAAVALLAAWILLKPLRRLFSHPGRNTGQQGRAVVESQALMEPFVHPEGPLKLSPIGPELRGVVDALREKHQKQVAARTSKPVQLKTSFEKPSRFQGYLPSADDFLK